MGRSTRGTWRRPGVAFFFFCFFGGRKEWSRRVLRVNEILEYDFFNIRPCFFGK